MTLKNILYIQYEFIQYFFNITLPEYIMQLFYVTSWKSKKLVTKQLTVFATVNTVDLQKNNKPHIIVFVIYLIFFGDKFYL